MVALLSRSDLAAFAGRAAARLPAAPLRRRPSAVAGPAEAPLEQLRHRPLGFLWHYVARRPLAHAVVVLSVLLAVGCSVGSQYAVKNLVDVLGLGPVAAGSAAWVALGLLAAVVAADNLLWRVGGWVATGAFTGVTRDLRADLFRHLAGHSADYFTARSPGVLAGRVTATSNAAWTVLSTFSWNTLPPAVAVVFAVALLGTVDGRMAAVLVLLSGGMGFLLARAAAAGRPLHAAYAERAAAVDGELVDVVQNVGLVRAFGATIRERARFDDTVGREVEARRASLRYLEKLRLAHAVATVALTVGLLAYAVTLWQAGRASTGDIVMVIALGLTILHATRDLAVALVDIVQHVARLAEAVETLLEPHALPDAPGALSLRVAGGGVEFTGVGFGYAGAAPGAEPVLRGLDLRIAPGQRVGLVGPSGAGKSTVLSLLQRFARPDRGRIGIDGQDLAGVTAASLCQAVAVVPQDVSLLNRTVMENIRYGRPDATDAEVFAAAEAAHCLDFIRALPDGFDTPVGQRGGRLSGGQRQRIAIARALLKDAPILLLDEATSALDSESEAAVQQALERLMRGRTVIAVAHRLATLRDFDRIVVMRAGRVADDGAPAELAARPGPFRDMLREQDASHRLAA